MKKKILLFIAILTGSAIVVSQTNWSPVGWSVSQRIVNGERQIRANLGSSGIYALTDTIKKYGASPLTFNNGLNNNSGVVGLGGDGIWNYPGFIQFKSNQSDGDSSLLTISTNRFDLTTVSADAKNRIVSDYQGVMITTGRNSSGNEMGLFLGGYGPGANPHSVFYDNIYSKGIYYSEDYSIGRTFPTDDNWIPNAKWVNDKISAIAPSSQIDNNMTASSTRGASRDAIISYFTSSLAAFVPPSQIDNDLTSSTTRGASRTAINGGLALKANLAGGNSFTGNQIVSNGGFISEFGFTFGSLTKPYIRTFTGGTGGTTQTGGLISLLSYETSAPNTPIETNIYPNGTNTGNLAIRMPATSGTLARLEDILTIPLTGYTAGSATGLTATTSVLNAFRNLQAQITANNNAVRLSGVQNPSANLTVTLAMFGGNGTLTIVANAGSGNITISVPASIPLGYTINLKKSDATANTVTISGNSSTYNGNSSDVLTTQNQARTYVSTATSTFHIF